MNARWILILATLALFVSFGHAQNICADVGGIGTQFINNPTSCSAWIACNSRKVVNIGSCDPGYYFDASVAACRSSSSVECNLSSVLNVCRGKADGAYVTNPQNCKGYYYCKDSVGFPGICEINYIFNGTLNQCVKNPNYVCPNGGGNSIGGSGVGSNTPCDYFSDGTFIASMTNCTNYNVCQNDQAIGGSCGYNLYFNPASGVCDQPKNVQCNIGGETSGSVSVTPLKPAEICARDTTNSWATFVSDPGSCNGYYYCPNGGDSQTAQHGNCPEGLWFDAIAKNCKEPKNSYCKIIPCYGKPIGYFERDLRDCSSYYYCGVDGASRGFCEIGYYFDEKNQRCNSYWAVQCETGGITPTPSTTTTQASTTSSTYTEPTTATPETTSEFYSSPWN